MSDPRIPGKVVVDVSQPSAAGVAVFPCPHCTKLVLVQQLISAAREPGESDG